MIETVLKNAAAAIRDNVSGVYYAGGAAERIQVNDGGVNKALPACIPDATFAGSVNPYAYKTLIPSTSEPVISFFQVLATTVVHERKNDLIALSSEVRLVVWGDLRRISPPDLDTLIMKCLSAMSAADLTTEYITSVKAYLTASEPKDGRPFNQYTMSEAETQYRMAPYDYRSILLDVRYQVAVSCLPDITPVTK